MRYFDLRAFLRNLRFWIPAVIIMVILCAAAVATICAARATAAYDRQVAERAEVRR